MFLKPIRKKNAFISKYDKKVIVSIPRARIQKIIGSEMSLWIPRDCTAYDKIIKIDNLAWNAVNKNNTLWFKNNLSEDQLAEYYRQNIQDDCIVALISDIQEPRELMFNNKPISTFNVLATEIIKNQASWCSVELELQGLFFYQKRFGVRWIIREISVFNQDPEQQDIDLIINDISGERGNIEDHWKEEAKSVIDHINNKFAKISAMPNMNESWETEINDLRRRIFNFVYK